MIDTEKFNYLIGCIVDQKFSLGDRSKGFDCLNSILFLYRGLGYEFPTELDGWTEENYAKKWDEDIFEGRDVLGRLVHILGKQVEKNYYIKGDLMIFGGNEIKDFPGIFLGNGNVLMVFDKGARVVPYHLFEIVHLETRRLVE